MIVLSDATGISIASDRGGKIGSSRLLRRENVIDAGKKASAGDQVLKIEKPERC
jgi:hypothetical protein